MSHLINIEWIEGKGQGLVSINPVIPDGFDRMDRALLLTLIDKFGGGPVGVETLAAAIGEERDTIEDVYEPFLIQEGYLSRTPKGRVATPLAFESSIAVRSRQQEARVSETPSSDARVDLRLVSEDRVRVNREVIDRTVAAVIVARPT